jgi:hypothetical protein
MERFYYRGYSTNPNSGNAPDPSTHDEALADFLASAEALARVCTRLESVTSSSGVTTPVRLRRDKKKFCWRCHISQAGGWRWIADFSGRE